MRESAGLLVIGVLCIYPLLFWALPAYLIGRYRPRFRSPIHFEDRTGPTANKPVIRRISREDQVGYGSNR